MENTDVPAVPGSEGKSLPCAMWWACVGGTGAATELGGSKGHGRLMHSLRLRGQGTAWSEMVPGLGLRLGSPAHTPHPLTPPHGPSLSTTRAHPRVQTSKNPASVLPPHAEPHPSLRCGTDTGFLPRLHRDWSLLQLPNVSRGICYLMASYDRFIKKRISPLFC